MFCFSSPLPFYFFDFCSEVCSKSGLFVCHTPVDSNLVVRLFVRIFSTVALFFGDMPMCSLPMSSILANLSFCFIEFRLSRSLCFFYQMIIYQSISFVLPPSWFAVFRERLPFCCGHCRRFGLQQNFENLDVEGEAWNVVVDEIGPLLYNGLFIGRGWTISCKDQKRKDRKRFTNKKIWTKVTLSLSLTLTLTLNLTLTLTPNPDTPSRRKMCGSWHV